MEPIQFVHMPCHFWMETTETQLQLSSRRALKTITRKVLRAGPNQLNSQWCPAFSDRPHRPRDPAEWDDGGQGGCLNWKGGCTPLQLGLPPGVQIQRQVLTSLLPLLRALVPGTAPPRSSVGCQLSRLTGRGWLAGSRGTFLQGHWWLWIPRPHTRHRDTL